MPRFVPDNIGILIRVANKTHTTSSGLALAEEKRRIVDRPSSGEVIAVGPDVKKVAVGETIYFDKYKCIEIVNPDTNEAMGAILESDYLGKILP